MEPARAQPEPDDDVLEALIAECVEAQWRDDPDAIARACAARPDLAAAVHAALAALGPLGTTPPWSGAGPHRPLPHEDDEFPERLGDYRLLRRLGGGGMGVVFLAEEEVLKRKIALKLIRAEHLYLPGARKRFHREIEAATRLEHPGIVKVHAVHRHAGIPLLAMEWLEGKSLGDVIASCQGRRPAGLTGRDLAATIGIDLRTLPEARARTFAGSWTETCFRLVAEVADALEHAHARGVLHRDVKPSNVMITVHGRAVLIDFGLARTFDAALLTQTVTQPGSLAYMSPEQLRGDGRIDGRTDVWSLGVTLFELLTLRLPFTGTSAEEVRRRILDGRPLALRDLNPGLSWEAETVCRTALELETSRRYQSAAEFAADLENVLARRPVHARRANVVLRGRRWLQRRPAIATALAVLGLVLLFGPLVLWVQEQHAVRRIENAHAQAEQFGLGSLAVVERMLTRIAEHDLAHIPHAEELRRELFADAVRHYESFLQLGVLQERFAAEKAWTEKQLGELHVELGNAEAGIVLLEQASAALGALAAAAPADLDRLDRQRRALAALAAAQQQLGRDAQATANYHAALDLTRTLPDGHAVRPADLLTTGAILNAMQAPANRAPQPIHIELALRAVEIFTLLHDSDPSDLRHLRGLALAEGNLGQLLQYTNEGRRARDAAEAPADSMSLMEQHLRRAVALHRVLAARGAATAADTAQRVADSTRLGKYLLFTRPDEGRALLEEAIADGERCATEFPGMVKALWSTVAARTALGARLPVDAPERERHLSRAVQLAAELRHRGDASPQSLFLLVETYRKLASTCRSHPGEAERHYRTALELAEGLRQAHDEPVALAETLQELAVLMVSQQRMGEAEECCRRVIAVLEPEFAPSGRTRGLLVICSAASRLAKLLIHDGRVDEAIPHLMRGRDLMLQQGPRDSPLLRVHRIQLAAGLVVVDRIADARAELDEAWPGDSATSLPGNPLERRELDWLGRVLLKSEGAATADLLVRVAVRCAVPSSMPDQGPGEDLPRPPGARPVSAIELLEAAMQRGYRDAAFLESAALMRVRDEPGFARVLESARR